MIRHRPLRSYVLRQGRISPAQQRALSELRSIYGIPYQAQPVDFNAVFGRDHPKVLEIGFGMGDTTAQIAQAYPDRDFIGVEVHSPGVGSLLKTLEALSLGSVRVIQHDVVEVVRDMIAPGTLAGVHIFFPDPWPKKRHHKRRLLQPEFVSLLAARLIPGGYLHVATDWEDYALQTYQVLSDEPMLENSAGGFAERPAYRPVTKFEQRGIKLGHGVWDLIFRRTASAAARDVSARGGE